MKDKSNTAELTQLAAEVYKLKAEVKQLRQATTTEKQFYHIKELSALTGLSVLALKGRRNRGAFAAVNDGNEVLIPAAEVKRFIAHLNKQWQGL